MNKIGTKFEKIKQEKGQSLVEFAMVLVIILIIIAGIIDLGRMFFYYISMRDAAQEGVLYGSAYPDQCANITNRATDLLSGSANVEVLINGKECSTAGTADRCSPKTITVNISNSNFNLTMPFIGAFVGTGNKISLHTSINGTILRPQCK